MDLIDLHHALSAGNGFPGIVETLLIGRDKPLNQIVIVCGDDFYGLLIFQECGDCF
jgi:hypothetical protein